MTGVHPDAGPQSRPAADRDPSVPPSDVDLAACAGPAPDALTEGDLAARLQAEGFVLRDGELPRVLAIARYLQQAAALIRVAKPGAP